ncbi:cation:proton antiporter [Bacillus salacetis]|uniref:Cation:proton antiporter n=1 Tax=Bacillus salacetis TaxID=2315464 RepID=A0A3A1R272_9BACI|nr:cation:proton antiporter [Bacillus salacetis]RIW32691.1 cation:proton antiporter [Bacillus salacetis]
MNLPLFLGLFLLTLFLTAYFGTKILRIPDIVIYILLGAGISLAGLLDEVKTIEVAGEIGLILLFFLLGMKYPLKEIGPKGRRVWKPGVLDIVLGVGVTAGICALFGQGLFNSLLIGGLVYATSSSITIKLLEHNKKLDRKESGYVLSLLIFEDMVAPILITILIGLSGEGFSPVDFVLIFLKVALLIGLAAAISHYTQKKAYTLVEKFLHEDYLLVYIIGLALAYGGFAVWLGLSEVIGAFLAGLMFAGTNFKDKIHEVALPVRNLFLPFFFLNFGLSLEFTSEIPAFGLLFTILLWSVVHKLIVGYIGGQWYGLSRQESFETGFSLAPRGEFSVIIAGLASGVLQIFAGVYILAAALLGMLLCQLSSRIGGRVYRKEKNA